MIDGVIKVTVRVTVDSAGNVGEASLEGPGPSRYFARLAIEAARKWKFDSAADGGPRAWLLRFEFSRNGVSARAMAGPTKTSANH